MIDNNRPANTGKKAIDEIIRVLKAPDPFVRKTGIWRLEQKGDLQSMEILAEIFLDTRGVSTRRAQEVFFKLYKKGILRDALDSDDHSTRIRAIRLVELAGITSELPAIVRLISDENNLVRRSAISALGTIGSRSHCKDLLSGLEDTDQEVRRLTIITLGKLCCKGAVDLIIPVLSDNDENIRVACVCALGEIKGREVLTPLCRAMKDESPLVRETAARCLGELGDHDAVPVLIEALEEYNNRVCASAASALGLLGDRSAVEHLLVCLADPDPGVQSAAVKSLSLLDAGELTALFQAAIKGNINARLALLRRGDFRIVPALIKILKEAWDYRNRAEALKILGSLGDMRAIDNIVEALDDDFARVRLHAAEALWVLTEGLSVHDDIGACSELVKASKILDNRARLISREGDPAVKSLLRKAFKSVKKKLKQMQKIMLRTGIRPAVDDKNLPPGEPGIRQAT
ncbi:MAG: HEAT repeat domain-containing protein [Candidatus Eremiobacteraeota bacterium]|nr:HEAT repeat domain-containing protein [Candidatus Eremiobacteraeota bacterium]